MKPLALLVASVAVAIVGAWLLHRAFGLLETVAP